MTQPVYPPQSQPQPIQQPEVVFYQDASPVYISSSRAIFFGLTFLTRNIISVYAAPVNAKKTGEIVLMVLGLIMAFVGFTTNFPKNPGAAPLIISLFILGICLFIFGLNKFFASKPQLSLVIGTPAGQSSVIISYNHAYIITLQNAVNQALLFNSR